MTGNSTFTGNVTSNGTGSFKNLIATDSLKIGSNGDATAQLNHGTKTVSVSVGGASMETANATLRSQLQTVSVSIAGGVYPEPAEGPPAPACWLPRRACPMACC